MTATQTTVTRWRVRDAATRRVVTGRDYHSEYAAYLAEQTRARSTGRGGYVEPVARRVV